MRKPTGGIPCLAEEPREKENRVHHVFREKRGDGADEITVMGSKAACRIGVHRLQAGKARELFTRHGRLG